MKAKEKETLLIVEDDPGLQKQLKWSFSDCEVILANDRSAALAEVRRHEPPVVLQDLGLPPDPNGVEEGMATLKEILAVAPHTKVIVVTGNEGQDNAVRAVGLGAYDFYSKPIETETLQLIVRRAFHIFELEDQNRRLMRLQARSPLDGLVATSPQMLDVCRLVEKVAPTSASVLLLGESGTGKELLAKALHALSDRASERFVAINCAAIPENLLESELYGYEKGAFTGAARQTPGKIEMADGGTLFLDEIGDMPLALQAKLLRFLQERAIERVGGRETISVDARVVCATNQDLAALIGEKQFREDLFYRINGITVNIPPLRDREGDKIILARELLQRFARHHGRTVKGFTDDAVAALQAYGWPGNVREMENKINSAVIMADASQISAGDLGFDPTESPDLHLNLRQVRHDAERHAVQQAMAVTGGNVTKAAELLGVTRPTLYDLLERLDISH